MFSAACYTGIVFNPDDTAENLKKNGGFIPGIRPGSNTAAYLRRIIFRLGAVGALYLTLVSLLPEILRAEYQVPFYFGGTSRSEEHTSELQSLMRISYAVFCLKKKKT